MVEYLSKKVDEYWFKKMVEPLCVTCWVNMLYPRVNRNEKININEVMTKSTPNKIIEWYLLVYSTVFPPISALFEND